MKGAPPAGVYAAGGLALGAATALGFWQHYNDNVVAPPRLWLADGPLREKVLPHCGHLLRSFAPTPWAANRHAQTVLGFMRTLTMRNCYTRQIILAVDGATLGLDWFDGCDAADFLVCGPAAPVLLVCHGINGGSHEGYAKWVCAAALAHGWRATVLNYRGCNGLPFTAPRGYAATMSHDIFTAVYSIKARYPNAPVVAVGYSLGGLKLTKYVAEADAGLHVPPPGQQQLFTGSGLAAAAVVSSPVSLDLSAAKISDPTSFSFLYNLAVAYKLRENISHHRHDIQALTRFDVDAALAAWTVGGIEEGGLPASLGFADRQQYYESCSSLDYIPAIVTPTLILLAEDDPFLGIVPDVECSRNPATLLALTRRGGHVAFLQGAWPLGRSYMDDAVMEFFAATLKHLYGYQLESAAAQSTDTAGEGVTTAAATPPGGPGGSSAAAEAPAEAPWVTDAARAGAQAAARVASAGGRPCAAEGCCGSDHEHSVAADGASAAGATMAAATSSGGAAPTVLARRWWQLKGKMTLQTGSGGDGVGDGGRGGAVGTAQAQQPKGSEALAPTVHVGSVLTTVASDNAPAEATTAHAVSQMQGIYASQLRLMLQLQQQLEQQRLVRAATAASAARGDKGEGAVKAAAVLPRAKL